MKELQVSKIPQKLTLLEKVDGKYKLVIQSEDNKPFRVCVDTEEYFDNNSPNYKNVSNGLISINIDALKNNVYELMISQNDDNPLTIRYNLQEIDDKLLNEENSKKIHDQRKDKLTHIANYVANLDDKYKDVLNMNLIEITKLYKEKRFEEAEDKLNIIDDIITNKQLDDIQLYLDQFIPQEEHHDNTNEKQETKSFFTSSTLNVIIITLVFFFLFIFLIMKFTNSSPSQLFSTSKVVPKNIFSLK
jgi:Fe2+ transport system protein B